MGSWMVWEGAVAGGVVQFFDKFVDVPVVAWGRSWWPCSSWTRLLTCPLLSRLGFVVDDPVVQVVAGVRPVLGQGR